MKKTLHVVGMSCGHCEMAVKKALSSVEGVSQVLVDLKTGKVSVAGENLNDNILKDVVEDAGYDVVTIE